MFKLEYCEISVGNGLTAKVDMLDVLLVLGRKWYAQRAQSGRIYAQSAAPNRVSMHRLIANPAPHAEVDHWNGDGLDNRRANLRECSKSQNLANRGKNKNNPHSYKGVCFRPLSKKRPWTAQIQANGRRWALGHFASELEAARAYDAKAEELWGEFAFLNFPHGRSASARFEYGETPRIR